MAPKKHGQLATEEELNDASWEGAKGALNGAARWGIYSGVLAGILYAISPIYRGLTFQFKIYLQMSGMTIGSMMEADRRLRDYEARARARRRIQRDHAVWKQWEEDFEVARAKDEVIHEGSRTAKHEDNSK